MVTHASTSFAVATSSPSIRGGDGFLLGEWVTVVGLQTNPTWVKETSRARLAVRQIRLCMVLFIQIILQKKRCGYSINRILVLTRIFSLFFQYFLGGNRTISFIDPDNTY